MSQPLPLSVAALGCSCVIATTFALGPTSTSQPEVAGPSAEAIVTRITRADYAGDRAALASLRDALQPSAADPQRASRLYYWRGFAMWRRAINGFNDAADPQELEQDLNSAVAEFRQALAIAPDFLDAKIGLLSSEGYLGYLGRGDSTARLTTLVRMLPLALEALVDDSEHPRLLWAIGPSLWYTPPGTPAEIVAARQARAMRVYETGLRAARAHAQPSLLTPLEPRWGEPELLMNLAWSNLNRVTPDLDAAEKQARSALALVPSWHYVRDILLPQILEARRKAAAR